MRPLQPPVPRVIPADRPRVAQPPAGPPGSADPRVERAGGPVVPRQERPRDLRAESTDDLSAMLAAAANTGRPPEGLEFREFDVEPPRERRGEPLGQRRAPDGRVAQADRSGASRAARAGAPERSDEAAASVRPDRPDARRPVVPRAADDRRSDAASRPGEGLGPFDRASRPQQSDRDAAPAPGPSDSRPARLARPAAAARPAGSPPGDSRPAGRRPARRGVMTRFASTVAMGFVALLAVATSVPSLSLLSPADVQAMALSETQVSIDGQRVDITGGAATASVAREGYQAQTIEEYARAAGIRPEATFTNNPLGTIQWPFAVGVHIGDRFGYRNCAGCSSNHRGQDFNPGDGAEIQSIADGVVSVSTDAGGSLGVVTMIDHVIDGQTVTSVYAHMQYNTRRFEVGDTVEVGDVVGNTGNTGMSTGPHLHFEIRIGGVGGTHVDPLEWLWANTN
ncbi:MAG TPA: peptidoglycan DD-metalloendopeptidase family protein [Agromyces sp.]